MPFASYKFVRHSPRWLGDYFWMLADPDNDQLHIVWSQPVDEASEPVARIFHAAAPL